MFQDPKGLPAGQSPSQGPGGDPALIAPPTPYPARVPLPAAPTGTDVPPVFGMLQSPGGMAQPPDAPTGWMPPMMPIWLLPAEQQTGVLLRMQAELQRKQAADSYEFDRAIHEGAAEAPMQADELRMAMLERPDQIDDLQGRVKELEPWLPPSRNRKLQDSYRRITEGRDLLKEFDAEFEKQLRGNMGSAVQGNELDYELDRTNADIKRLKKEAESLPKPPGFSPSDPNKSSAEIADMYRQMANPSDKQKAVDSEYSAALGRRKELLEKGAKEYEPNYAAEALKGLNPFTSEPTAKDEMLGYRNRAAEAVLGRRAGLGDKPFPEWLIAGHQPSNVTEIRRRVEAMEAALPPGWTMDMWKGATAEKAASVVDRLARDTAKGDYARSFGSAVGWLPVGAGTYRLAAKGAELLGKTVLKQSPRLLKAMQGVTRYLAGPAALDAAIGAARPLPQEQQAQIEAAPEQDQHSLEVAYRTLQATRDASFAVLFGLTGAGKSLRGVKVPAKASESFLADAIKLGVLGPAVPELASKGLGEMATRLRSNDSGAMDVLADLYAAKGMTGRLTEFYDAATAGDTKGAMEKAADYFKEALPGMVGVGTVHLWTTVKGAAMRRNAMLELRRQAHGEIDKLSVDDKAKVTLKTEIDRELESVSMGHADDEFAGLKERVAEQLGGEDAVKAHRVAEERAADVAPDVPGSVLEKAQTLAVEAQNRGADPEVARQHEAMDHLHEAAKAGDEAKARTMAEVAARERDVPQAAEDAGVRSRIADSLEERPGQEHLKAVDERQSKEWDVVSHDVDTGAVRLRAADEPTKTVVIRQDELSAYRVRIPKAEPAPVAKEAPLPPIRDEHYDRAVAAVRAGHTSVRKLQKELGVSYGRASKMMKELVEGGVLLPPEGNGKGYRINEAPKPEGDEANQRIQFIGTMEPDTEQTFRDVLHEAQRVAEEFDASGSSTHLDENVDSIVNRLLSIGDEARPDDPQQGTIEAAAWFLTELPSKHRTDDLIRRLGLSQVEVAAVRDRVRQIEEPLKATHEDGETPVTTRAKDEDGTELRHDSDAIEHDLNTKHDGADRAVLPDVVKASKQVAIDDLPPHLRELHAKALALGSEHTAADEVYRAWLNEEHDMEANQSGHEGFVKGYERLLDDLMDDLTNAKKPRERQEALDFLADQMRMLSMPNGEAAMLSLTPESRRVLQRMRDLWHCATEKLEIHRMKPLRKMRGESGSASIGTVLVSPFQAAALILRAVRRTPGKLFRIGARVAAFTLRAGGKVTGIGLGNERVAADVSARADTVVSKNVGAYKSSAIDNLTKWGEPTLVEAEHDAKHNSAIVQQATEQLHRVLLREDKDFDHKFNKWLEYSGIPEEKRTKEQEAHLDEMDDKATPAQRELMRAFPTMFENLRKYIARWGLPDQMLRRRILRLLGEQLTEHDSMVQHLEGELQQRLDERAVARNEARSRGARTFKDDDGWHEAERAVRRARTAAGSARDNRAKVAESFQRIGNEIEDIVKKWGVVERGFSAAVPNRDPQEAIVEARNKGLADAVEAMNELSDILPKTLEEMRKLTGENFAKDLLEPPRAGHFMARGDVLEGAGMRDKSALRSFFHYSREVYRLLPVARWYEHNYERIYGTPRIVTRDELILGKTIHGGQEVEFVPHGDPAPVRSATRRRLGGQVFTLKAKNAQGHVKEVHFRTFADAKTALANAASDVMKSKIVEKWEWLPPKEQNLGARVVLLQSSAARALGMSRKPRVGSVEHETIKVERETTEGEIKEEPLGRLALPEDSILRWPTELVGRVMSRVEGTGKYFDIQKEHGPQAATGFIDYLHRSQKQALGREIPGGLQRAISAFFSIPRHSYLGLMQPRKALKELGDALSATAMVTGPQRAFESLAWAAEHLELVDKAMRNAYKADVAGQIGGAVRGEKVGERQAMNYLRDLSEPDVNTGKVLMRQLEDGLRTPKQKLARMSPDKRAEREMLDDAHVALVQSGLTGTAMAEHFGSTARRDFAYGEPLFLRLERPENMAGLLRMARHAGQTGARAAGKASWFMRQYTQNLNMALTHLVAYMSQRRIGKSDAVARDVAFRFALAQGNIASRLTQPDFFNTARGEAVKPLFSWVQSQWSTNYRYLFHKQQTPQWGGRAMQVGRYMMRIYLYSQLGQMFGRDLTQNIGGGLGQVPVVGPLALWSSHKLQSTLSLIADPEDARRELPGWRQKLVSLAPHLPQFMQEWYVRRAQSMGAFAGDIPLPPFLGTQAPMVFSMAEDAWTWLAGMKDNAPVGDKQRAEARDRLLFTTNDYAFVWNQLFGSIDDPKDPGYAFITSPATGITRERVKKGERVWRVMWNMLYPSLEDGINRTRNSILDPMRDKMVMLHSSNEGFKSRQMLIRARDLEDAAGKAKSQEQASQLRQQAAEQRDAFMDDIKRRARDEQMTVSEARSLVQRMRLSANAEMNLTAQERDIINAPTTDEGLKQMTAALNDFGQPITRERFNTVLNAWYPNGDAAKQLRRVSKETREKFLSAYRTAVARWESELRTGSR